MSDIRAWTETHPEAAADPVNPRRLTNIGTFRGYIAACLHARSDIRDGMTFLVRQRDPAPQGLPLEVYVFVADTRWPVYEAVQSDVFDHLFAIIGEFALRVFQEPSGRDVRLLASPRD